MTIITKCLTLNRASRQKSSWCILVYSSLIMFVYSNPERESTTPKKLKIASLPVRFTCETGNTGLTQQVMKYYLGNVLIQGLVLTTDGVL